MPQHEQKEKSVNKRQDTRGGIWTHYYPKHVETHSPKHFETSEKDTQDGEDALGNCPVDV